MIEVCSSHLLLPEANCLPVTELVKGDTQQQVFDARTLQRALAYALDWRNPCRVVDRYD